MMRDKILDISGMVAAIADAIVFWREMDAARIDVPTTVGAADLDAHNFARELTFCVAFWAA
jgi:hypothetical protein